MNTTPGNESSELSERERMSTQFSGRKEIGIREEKVWRSCWTGSSGKLLSLRSLYSSGRLTSRTRVYPHVRLE